MKSRLIFLAIISMSHRLGLSIARDETRWINRWMENMSWEFARDSMLLRPLFFHFTRHCFLNWPFHGIDCSFLLSNTQLRLVEAKIPSDRLSLRTQMSVLSKHFVEKCARRCARSVVSSKFEMKFYFVTYLMPMHTFSNFPAPQPLAGHKIVIDANEHKLPRFRAKPIFFSWNLIPS